MKLVDYINKELIFLDMESPNKDELMADIVARMAGSGMIKNPKHFLTEVYEREKLGSTGVGNGIALPHARTQDVDEIVIAIARLKTGIDFGSQDGKPVKLVFLLGTPLKTVSEYLKVLAGLSRTLRDEDIRKSLFEAESVEKMYQIFKSI